MLLDVSAAPMEMTLLGTQGKVRTTSMKPWKAYDAHPFGLPSSHMAASLGRSRRGLHAVQTDDDCSWAQGNS